MNDVCLIKPLNGVVVQQNGIIRNSKGRIIGRTVDDVPFDSEHLNENDLIADAMESLTKVMKDTSLGGYAHSWHCNIAMSVYDASLSSICHDHAHQIGNDAASRFMKLCFGVETTNETPQK